MTDEMKKLVAHIDSKREAWFKECERLGHTPVGYHTSDPKHWESYGITNIEQYEHYCASMDYFEAYRSMYGIKPNWVDFDAMTTVEIDVMNKKLQEEINEDLKAEQIAKDTLTAKMKKLCKELHCTMQDLFRWKVVQPYQVNKFTVTYRVAV